MRIFGRIFSVLVLVCICTSAAFADDWVATKLRGGVFVFENGAWLQIKRGHVVSDDSAIQTAKRARVVFSRGKETIDIKGDTRIRISDREGASRTVVSQDFGEITVDVEKRNVEHFEVRSPLLAAVVKGTKFTASARDGKASIKVERGRVEARDDKADMKVDVMPNQNVAIDKDEQPVLMVEGRGKKEPIRAMKSGKVLSVKQIIEKVEKARPSSPVVLENVETIAAQQGTKMSDKDMKFAAAKQMKAAKKSGKAKAIAQAKASMDVAKDGRNAKNVAAALKAKQSSDASKDTDRDDARSTERAAKKDVKAAEKALKVAKKSGDERAIQAAETVKEAAKENVKTVRQENAKAKKETPKENKRKDDDKRKSDDKSKRDDKGKSENKRAVEEKPKGVEKPKSVDKRTGDDKRKSDDKPKKEDKGPSDKKEDKPKKEDKSDKDKNDKKGKKK